MEKRLNIFICYSLDSKEHQERLIHFNNQLRNNSININSNMAIFVAGIHTADLFQTILKKNDYIIIVLTYKYVEKANVRDLSGKKANILLSYVRKFKDKIIPISFDKIKEMPFYLADKNYIDFNKGESSSNFKKLINYLNKK